MSATVGGQRLASGEPTAVRRIARILPALGLAVLLVVDGVLVFNAVRVVQAAGAAIAYPFELDFAEGLVLGRTRTLAAGGALYPPADASLTAVSAYTPVYYAAAALLGNSLGDHLAAGRGLALASALLAALTLAALAWRAIDTAGGLTVRTFGAACAGLAFLQISYTASWAALMRVDILAVLFAFIGVLLFAATAARGPHVYWCVVPFALAVYTKQTTVAAAAACVLTAARGDLQRGVRLGLCFAVAVLLIGGAMQLATHGAFAFHVVWANMHPYHLEQAASFMQDIAIRYPVLIALAAATVPGLLGSAPAAHPASNTRQWTRAVLGAYLPLAVLVSVTVGKVGADVNYFIEPLGVICVCAALAAAEALRPGPDAGGWGLAGARAARAQSAVNVRAIESPGSGASVVAVAVPLLLLWQVLWVTPPAALESIEVPPPAQQARVATLLDAVRHVDGPVLSEDLTLLSLAGKPMLLQPFEVTQLVYRHAYDESPLLAALRRGEVPLVVLRFDVRRPPRLAFDRFTPATITAVREHYQLRSSFPGYWVYTPDEAGDRREVAVP